MAAAKILRVKKLRVQTDVSSSSTEGTVVHRRDDQQSENFRGILCRPLHQLFHLLLLDKGFKYVVAQRYSPY